MPIRWRHAELYRVERDIGRATQADADLFLVLEDGVLQLTLPLIPNNLQAQFRGPSNIWLTTVARGINGQSGVLTLKVDWNGKWHGGETEMKDNLQIKVVPSEEFSR